MIWNMGLLVGVVAISKCQQDIAEIYEKEFAISCMKYVSCSSPIRILTYEKETTI